jgi:uroporphyrinogen-III decarboxylase
MNTNIQPPPAPRTGRAAVEMVLNRRRPDRIVYAPNCWQWLAHHRAHHLLPDEAAACETLLDFYNHLGVDVFSRNIYCDEKRRWFGGLTKESWDGLEVTEREYLHGRDLVTERTYHTRGGAVDERLRFVFEGTTLVQETFPINDYDEQMEALEHIVEARRWRFDTERYQYFRDKVGGGGLVVAGDLHSPLKMLHLLLGPENTTYLLMDHPERVREILAAHEVSQLDLVRQMAEAGVRAMMSMDNLDTMFHPPGYVEQYSASFYEKASRICHDHGATFFIHACGRQKANLKLIASLGVDGLEGVAYPPLGDIELDEAMEATGDRFIITGGISAMETDRLTTRRQVFEYVDQLFRRMRPFAHRFMFSASCNTATSTRWEQLLWFRDAWREYGAL